MNVSRIKTWCEASRGVRTNNLLSDEAVYLWATKIKFLFFGTLICSRHYGPKDKILKRKEKTEVESFQEDLFHLQWEFLFFLKDL